ncbi:MAG: hypothetical protein KF716_33635 [Anaerolineae bacterium]|nr:hypothetical protein [Anaerolineae bacterium]
MSSQVTLTLSEATLQRAQRLARQRRTTVEDVLTDWLEHGDSTDDIAPLESGHQYFIYTPLGCEAAAHDLWELYLKDHRQDQAE